MDNMLKKLNNLYNCFEILNPALPLSRLADKSLP